MELISLVHRGGCLLVVTTSNQIEPRLLTDLNALVVVRQGHVQVIDPVVKLEAGDAVRLPIILQQVLRVFLQDVDVAREGRELVRHHGNLILVLCHYLLYLLV